MHALLELRPGLLRVLRPLQALARCRQARLVQALPLLRRVIQHQRLADTGARQRHTMADPRAHFRAVAAGVLVQVEHLVVFTNRQVNGVAGQRRQLVQVRHCQVHQGQLFTGLEPQLDQLGAQQVTDLGHHAQVALVHQATGQAVRRAARGADAPGDLLEIPRTSRHRLHHAQAAQQGLGAGGGGVFDGGVGVFLHIGPISMKAGALWQIPPS